jgi:enoyl-CoA hydratase
MTEQVSVRVERRDGVLVVTLDRPEARNAVDSTVARQLAAAMDRLDADDDVAVGILTGAGGTFCAGMDLKAFLRGEQPELPGRGFGGLTEARPRKPLIAAVEGYALAGGCELVLACDLVVAASDAQFGLPEVGIGLFAGAGGLIRLPQRIPRQVAMEFALTGDRFGAPDAHRWGLVNRLTEPRGGQRAGRRAGARRAHRPQRAARGGGHQADRRRGAHVACRRGVGPPGGRARRDQGDGRRPRGCGRVRRAAGSGLEGRVTDVNARVDDGSESAQTAGEREEGSA